MSDCIEDKYSSRVCEKGTKCCNVQHKKSECDEALDIPDFLRNPQNLKAEAAELTGERMNKRKVTGWICGPRFYEYKGCFFEVSGCSGPWPLCKNGEPRKRAGNVFWKLFDEFMKEKDISKFRVGGGCVQI